MSKTSSILPVAIVAGLVFLAGTIRTAAAMDGNQPPRSEEDQCLDHLKTSGLDRAAAAKLYGTPRVHSVSIGLNPVRPLAAGETVDVVVEGEFSEGTTFSFGGWSSLSEDASFDHFEIVTQELVGSTLHAKIKAPNAGKGKTYVNLIATALGKSCSTGKGHLLLQAVGARPGSEGNSPSKPSDSSLPGTQAPHGKRTRESPAVPSASQPPAAQTSPASPGVPTDAEAHALLQRLNTQPSAPLTPAGSQLLAN